MLLKIGMEQKKGEEIGFILSHCQNLIYMLQNMTSGFLRNDWIQLFFGGSCWKSSTLSRTVVGDSVFHLSLSERSSRSSPGVLLWRIVDDECLLEESQFLQCKRSERGAQGNQRLYPKQTCTLNIWALLVGKSLTWTPRKYELLKKKKNYSELVMHDLHTLVHGMELSDVHWDVGCVSGVFLAFFTWYAIRIWDSSSRATTLGWCSWGCWACSGDSLRDQTFRPKLDLIEIFQVSSGMNFPTILDIWPLCR